MTRQELDRLEQESGADLISIDTDRDLYEYDALYINAFGKSRTFKLPMTYDAAWIINKINTMNASSLGSLAVFFNKHLVNGKLYAASYGLGCHILYQNEEKMKEEVGRVREQLGSHGIEYREEYSQALWVHRFVLSQSKENLAKISAAMV